MLSIESPRSAERQRVDTPWNKDATFRHAEMVARVLFLCSRASHRFGGGRLRHATGCLCTFRLRLPARAVVCVHDAGAIHFARVP